MFFESKSGPKLSLFIQTEFIDFSDSKIAGGSEISINVWGLPLSEPQVERGMKKAIVPRINPWKTKDGITTPRFFSNEFWDISKITVQLHAQPTPP